MLPFDYEQLAANGMSAEKLAQTFLRAYLDGNQPIYPLNPFQMLKDMGVAFTFRPFKRYEGVYIPAKDEADLPIVGINSQRPIARQRFTAAHELCHHLKDARRSAVCTSNPQSEIERYAENFAAELLMPSMELKQQVNKRAVSGYVELSDVLEIAEYFGVSFQSCLNKIAWRLHRIKGDISPTSLLQKRRKFKPSVKRQGFGFNDVALYEQLFDSAGSFLRIEMTPRVRQRFKTEYIFHDSRMEGVRIESEKAAEIVVDLRLLGAKSIYCNQKSQNLVEVAGLSIAYDYIFDALRNSSLKMNIYEMNRINEKLYSVAPCPDAGGLYRTSNALITDSKCTPIDCRKISIEMYHLDKDLQCLLNSAEAMPISKYIEKVLCIHHRLTVIHAFNDGNGRTIRAFTNMLLLLKNLPPVLFRGNEKNFYKAALAKADSNSYSELYEVYFKALIRSYVELSVL